MEGGIQSSSGSVKLLPGYEQRLLRQGSASSSHNRILPTGPRIRHQRISSRPRPIRAAAHVQLLAATTVAATPNGRTKVIAARGWLNETRMKGQATPSMASGRAMAKKALLDNTPTSPATRRFPGEGTSGTNVPL